MLSTERRRRRHLFSRVCRRILFNTEDHSWTRPRSTSSPPAPGSPTDDDDDVHPIYRQDDLDNYRGQSTMDTRSSDFNVYETIGDPAVIAKSKMASESNMSAAGCSFSHVYNNVGEATTIFSPPIDPAPTGNDVISTSGLVSLYELPLYPVGSTGSDAEGLVDRVYTVGAVLGSFRALAAHLPRVERFAAELEARARQAEALLQQLDTSRFTDGGFSTSNVGLPDDHDGRLETRYRSCRCLGELRTRDSDPTGVPGVPVHLNTGGSRYPESSMKRSGDTSSSLQRSRDSCGLRPLNLLAVRRDPRRLVDLKPSAANNCIAAGSMGQSRHCQLSRTMSINQDDISMADPGRLQKERPVCRHRRRSRPAVQPCVDSGGPRRSFEIRASSSGRATAGPTCLVGNQSITGRPGCSKYIEGQLVDDMVDQRRRQCGTVRRNISDVAVNIKHTRLNVNGRLFNVTTNDYLVCVFTVTSFNGKPQEYSRNRPGLALWLM